MIPYDQMPEHNTQLAKRDVTFSPLHDDSEESCPVSLSEIIDYLRVESPDFDRIVAAQLTFLRTAQVAEKKYWIWSFLESDGTKCYATVSQDDTGTTCVGYEENYGNWTPEQYMLGDYYNVF